MSIYAVIMCGGVGSRLWPVSSPELPKQFIPLIGPQSSFQQTVARVSGLEHLTEIVIVTGTAHEASVRSQIMQAECPVHIILEPEPRDSAPAMAAAAAWIYARDENGVAVFVASDHYVPDHDAFTRAASHAVAAARGGAIVTLGVKPLAPSSAYGYIAPGAPLDGFPDIVRVKEFVEKPDEAGARQYISEGFLWNSGNFVVSAKTLLLELDNHAPKIAQAARQAVAGGRASTDSLLLSENFKTAPKISIDYAVMEKTAHAAVLPVDFEWSDLGAWDAVWAHSQKDAHGNAQLGRPLSIDARNTLVQDHGKIRSAVIGVENIAIITHDDHVLVCALDASQKVKAAYDAFGAEKRLEPIKAERQTLAQDLKGWLELSALPLWWSMGADHRRGGFHEELDANALATPAPRRMRVQARQAYVYGRAGADGWPGPWRQAVSHGLNYLFEFYQRPDGLFRTLVDRDGHSLDDTAKLYDQAFMLLALSANPEPEAETQASALMDLIEQHMTHSQGGFREAGDTPFLSNPHMHLLEAALAWDEAGADSRWRQIADNIAELCMSRFIDGDDGFLREVFDQDWKPADGASGRRVEPGHQFEWAWLLERWGVMRDRADATEAARKLFTSGARGVDPLRGLVMNAIDASGSRLDPAARLWPQTERLKAALILSRRESDGQTYDPHIIAAARGIQEYLCHASGLWKDNNLPGGDFAAGCSPASTLYHLYEAIKTFSHA